MSEQDLFMRMLDLTSQGYACSQILLMLGMELNGEENSAVVRTMAGLNEGMYGSGRLCGCLTGGSCLLGYFSGKGLEAEACGIFPDQGLNPCLLHWQADSHPLDHEGNPTG